MMLTRRQIALGALAAGGVGVTAIALRSIGVRATAAAPGKFEVSHTPAEWRKLLTPEQYAVLREQGTERPFSSPHDREKRKGTFTCAGCDLPLFASETKFDSGTGWPSFYAPIEGAVEKDTDYSFGFVRDQVHCHHCGGHQGHIFNDGPKPTGLRYCINGVAMKFVAA